jgi:hypothetical protein
MAQLVAFDPPMERLVRFVEDTPPAEIVAATYRELESGAAPRALLMAAGLAVSRSTELPNQHHGGPVHAVSGLHAISQLGARLDGVKAFLPAIQSVALANKHVHSPDMGPGAMAALAGDGLAGKSLAELLAGFEQALENRIAPRVERHLLALLPIARPDDIMEVLLRVALPRNALDDHYFLYTVYAFRALDSLGWDHADVLLRPPVRFLARHPNLEHEDTAHGAIIEDGVGLYHDYAALERLADNRILAQGEPRFDTGEGESDAIDALATIVAMIDTISAIADPVADAMAGGLSVMGTLEALSIGGARRFLRSQSGNPFDVHFHTGVNARRYLLSLPGLRLRTKILALLSWGLGYEVRHLDRMMAWPVGAAPETIAALPERDANELLDAITESVIEQPECDLGALTGSIADLIAPASVRDTIALAQQYAERGYDPEPFFARMAEFACRDDQSEMHAYKLQQAAYEEYHATREPYRWVHLVSAAMHAAGIAPLRPQTVYPCAHALIDA